MSIDKNQLRTLIIRPTLQYLNLWSEAAENLLMGTAAQESQLGTYIHQLGKGPALGIFQMEPNTFKDIQDNYLKYKKDLNELILESRGIRRSLTDPDEMIGNLYYATAMCRVHYLRVSERLPEASDLQGMAAYWKKYYNTNLGKGTVEEFINNYKKYVE